MATDFLAGCLGGCAGVAVGHPLDTVKVRIQTQDPRNPMYRGTFQCLRSIVQQESFRGLYKGMTSPMAGVAVINALLFGVYGNVQRRLPQPDALSSHAIAGATAGFIQAFIASPMELVKTRLQVQGAQGMGGGGGGGAPTFYRGPVDCLRQIWAGEGTRGIFRGLGITIVREIPAFGTYFWTYEVLTQSDNTEPISTMRILTAGGMAGIMSWVVTYPIDVLKSRLQVDGWQGPRQYGNAWECVKKSYQAEGYHGFFRGLPSTIIRAFPVNAATFAVVTWSLRLMTPLEEKQGYDTGSEMLKQSRLTTPNLHLATDRFSFEVSLSYQPLVNYAAYFRSLLWKPQFLGMPYLPRTHCFCSLPTTSLPNTAEGLDRREKEPKFSSGNESLETSSQVDSLKRCQCDAYDNASNAQRGEKRIVRPQDCTQANCLD